ncbi:MAG: hypothetical protein MUO53_09895 [Maribacter sp.]|nr:hypothetical protein [Maribacter sp.]
MVAKGHQKLLAEHNLAIGRFLFYEGIVVGEIYEGVHVTIDNAAIPFHLAEEQYGKEKPVVYISHRLYSYSIDPVGYYKGLNRQFPNLVAFAIVSQNRSRRMLAKFEKLFIKKPVEVFNTMESAFMWAEKQLLKNTGDIKVMEAKQAQ